MIKSIEMASSVVFIEDPNAININPNIVNAISDYQDMHINVELTAVRRGRSTITNAVGVATSTTGVKTDDLLVVNFIGANLNKGNPNYLNFTTNYYDGSSGINEIQSESFGISNIKIVINSSFVPQIDITFVDLRGLSFFNQENSPYRILFDFPPPFFNLKIKGYYGRTLEYQLHLVKYTSEFKSENGNFVIDAQFIAITFAPLTDVLFRYIVNTPLIEETGNLSSLPSEKPINTNDFIRKLKAFYASDVNSIPTSTESKEFEENGPLLSRLNDALISLENYKTSNLKNNYPILFVAETVNATEGLPLPPQEIPNFVELDNLAKYNEYSDFGSNQSPSSFKNRLFIGYIKNSVNITNLAIILNQYANQLDVIAKSFGLKDATISAAKDVSVNNGKNTYPNGYGTINDTYFGIDITNYYVSLCRKITDTQNRRVFLANYINTQVSDAILGKLGMIPTIYQVFKLILDDVDNFFRQLRNVSRLADAHHETYKSLIISPSLKENNTKIYPFPLITKLKTIGCVQQEERDSPKAISNKLPQIFPEIDFINKFIDTFNRQAKQQTLDNERSETNSDGTYLWIPISPIDSSLGSSNSSSPYTNVHWTNNAPSTVNEIFNLLLNRFYILTEYVLTNKFYDESFSSNYVDLFSESEAANLVLNLTNENEISLVHSMSKKITSANDFYNYLSSNSKEITNYTTVDPDTIVNAGDNIYINKKNAKYTGTTIYTQPISLQVVPNDGPIHDFITNFQTKKYNVIYGLDFTGVSNPYSKLPNGGADFTYQNTMWIRDNSDDSITTKTKFLAKIGTIKNNSKYSQKFYNTLLTQGNQAFKSIGYDNGPKSQLFVDAVSVWANSLAFKTDELVNEISKNSDITAIIILSALGNGLGPFNIYPNNLNGNIFTIPAAIEVPFYLPAYIGSLIVAKEKGLINKITSFFYNNTLTQGFYLAADYFDVNTYLSVNDMLNFKNAYLSFYNDNSKSGCFSIRDAILSIINGVARDESAINVYINRLSGDYSESIMIPLLNKKNSNIIVNTENCFGFYLNPPDKYESLFDVNKKYGNKKTINNNFFEKLFKALNTQLRTKIGKLTKDKKELNAQVNNDNDITTQLYYSFKNINDKWLTNPNGNNNNNLGYPFNYSINNNGIATNNVTNLIDSFVFVDRAMNPIGDTVINPEILIDLFNDPNVSVFSVLSQLLSVNHFEFFPLQNFMTHTPEAWNDTFKIITGNDATKQVAFVCMYIGGTSSYPTNISGNGFENDGITDISNIKDIPDFNECNGNKSNSDTGVANNNTSNTNFPYKQVRAFRVMFGQQNQSMFKDIKIDSKEYPETNESIQILSSIADHRQIPKGQNLFSLYENRAYSATVTGLGNAMIQPTQYFQLDNVPLFNGAYLILTVEHNIVPNNMITSFTGTKILKYPIPRVTNPAAAINFQGSTGEFMTEVLNSVQPGQTIQNKNLLNPIVLAGGQINTPLNPYAVNDFSAFGDRTLSGQEKKFHPGNDFGGPSKTPIWAVKRGLLTTHIDSSASGGYGNYAVIDHQDGSFSLYGHLSSPAFPHPTINQPVNAGDVIGWLGNSGFVVGQTGNHLHFGYQFGKTFDIKTGTINNTKWVDPKPYLASSMAYVWSKFS